MVFLLLFSISRWGNMTDMMRFCTPRGNLSLAHPAAELIWKYRVTQALLHTDSHTAVSALAISYHPNNKRFVKAFKGFCFLLLEVNVQQWISYNHQRSNTEESNSAYYMSCIDYVSPNFSEVSEASLSDYIYQQTAELHKETGNTGTEKGLVRIHTDVCQAPESILFYF